MTTRRNALALLAGAAAAPLVATAGRADDKPSIHLATIFVGFPPGGATDMVARLVADAIQGKYADAVIVQNRTGAGGQIAAVALHGAPTDGSTLLFTPAFPMVIHPHIYKEIRYDTLKDFVPVATTHFGTMAISVGPAVPDTVKTVGDLVAWVKANPEKASFGAPPGSSQHFTGLMFARAAGINLQMISYRGGAPAITDALGGHVPIIVSPLAEVLEQARGGQIRILAITSKQRSALTPDIPTLSELGYNIVLQDWSGFLAPAGTPPEVVARANAMINVAMETPRVKDMMAKLGMEVGTLTPAAFADTVRESWERYRDIVKESGFHAE